MIFRHKVTWQLPACKTLKLEEDQFKACSSQPNIKLTFAYRLNLVWSNWKPIYGQAQPQLSNVLSNVLESFCEIFLSSGLGASVTSFVGRSFRRSLGPSVTIFYIQCRIFYIKCRIFLLVFWNLYAYVRLTPAFCNPYVRLTSALRKVK